MKKEQEVRRCVVCRRSSLKPELLRFVCSPGVDQGWEIDVFQAREGRGAYCHLKDECLFNKLTSSLVWASLQRTKIRRGAKRSSAEGGSTDLSAKNVVSELHKFLGSVQLGKLSKNKKRMFERVAELLENFKKRSSSKQNSKINKRIVRL